MSNRWPNKVVVGLTGNIATGKSVILNLAEERGALALDADAIVHEILAADHGAQRAVANALGPAVRQPDGAIDRGAVAAIVFNDEAALRELEQILHPRVRRRLLDKIQRRTEEVVFIEAIKLLESGLADECDQIWVTRCPEGIQRERLMAYRNLDEATALMRIKAQSSQDLKVAAADVVIDTGGTLDQTRTNFELAWKRLQRRIAASALSAEVTAQGELADGEQTIWQDHEPADNGEPAVVRQSQATQPRNFEAFGEGIIVRRAQPADIPAIIELARQASDGAITLDHGQLLTDLGARGYLIGQQEDKISTIAGWNADNLVATIDSIYIHPLAAVPVTGAAVLKEIELTANELTCEVIIALPNDNWPAGIRQILNDNGFDYVVPESLPQVWKAAVADAGWPASSVMLKVLRDTRQVHIRIMKKSAQVDQP